MNKKDFKNYITAHYNSNPNVKDIKVNGNADYYVAKLDYGAFEECVLIIPSTEYNAYETVALSYKIYGYKNIVSIYDLLSFLEIDDYNVYTFKTMLSEDSLNQVLDLYDGLTNQYYSDLKLLSTDEAVQEKMTKLLVENLCLERIEDEPDFKLLKKEAIADLADLEASAYSSMMYVDKNNGKHSKASVIRALSKYEDTLDTFEKRVLNYLKGGGELPKPLLKMSRGSYRKYVLKALGISIAIALIPTAYSMIYNLVIDREIVNEEGIGFILGVGSFGTFLLAMGIIILFARYILKAISPKGLRDEFVKRFVDELEKREAEPSKNWFSRLLEKVNKGILILAGIGAMVFGLIILLVI